MRQITIAGFHGDPAVDSDVEAARGRCGAERADPRRWSSQPSQGHAPAKEPRGKAIGGGRDAQNKKVPPPREDYDTCEERKSAEPL